MLVLDNADEASYLFQPPDENVDNTSSDKANADGKRLFDYLPICPHGSVVVTTRNQDTAREMVDNADIITVQPMGEELSLALLGKKIGPQSDRTTAKRLTAALEYMPLAISQAAAYIK